MTESQEILKLFQERPDIVPEQYQESIIKHLTEGVSKTQAAKSVGISRPSWQRHLDKVQRALETFQTFHVEGDALDPTRERVQYIHPNLIDVMTFQPRLDDEPGTAFIEDIRRHGGNHQAITVREKPRVYGKKAYDCIKGHRRLKALLAINEGLSPEHHLLAKCVIEPLGDKQAALESLVDNMFHKDMETADRDLWIAKLVIAYGWTPSQLDERFEDLGADAISNIVRSYRDASIKIRELLEKRMITVGHAKAVVSLDHEDQERIADRIVTRVNEATKNGDLLRCPSVREVEAWAQRARNRNEAISRLEAYFRELVQKGENTLSARNPDEILEKTLGGYRFNDYRVRDYDISTAAKNAGITIEYQPVTESLKELREKYGTDTDKDEVLPQPEQDGSRPPSEIEPEGTDEPPEPLCRTCKAFSHAEQICGLELLETDPNEVFECAGFLHSSAVRPYVPRCPICDHQTVVLHGDTPYVRHTADSIGLKHDHPHAEFAMHAQCLVKHLVKHHMLSGKCETCRGGLCPFINSYNLAPLVGQVRMAVKECGYFSPAEKISAVNKWADGQYKALQHEAGGTSA